MPLNVAALMALAEQLAASPDGILQKLTETALTLCGAHSAGGVGFLEPDGKRFYWPAISGQWVGHVGGGTPRDFGPCGTVLDCDAALLFSHPELDFDYFAPVTPLVEEALLMPFYVNGKAVGTVWVVIHDLSRRFDSEDLRLMTDLGAFAASALSSTRFFEQSSCRLRRHQVLLMTPSSPKTWMASSPVGMREPNTCSATSTKKSSASR